MGPIGPGMALGILLGGLIGVIAGLLLLGRGKVSGGAKALLALPAMLAGLVAGGAAGLFVGLLIDLAFIANSPVVSEFRDSAQYEKLPLRRAACANDLDTVRTQLAKPLDGLNARLLGRIIDDCTLSINAKVPPGDAMLRLLLPVLHAQYVAAPARTDVKRYPLAEPDYCGLLELLILRLEVDKLRLIASTGLPLHCRDGASHMALERFADNELFKTRPAEFEALIALIGGKNGPIGAARTQFGSTLLDQVVNTHDVAFIVIALEAGVDPGRPDPFLGVPAVLRWTTRKFTQLCIGCVARKPLSDSEIARVDKLMRPPSAQEFTRFYGVGKWPGSVLHDFRLFQDQPDGGAAYFNFLRARGADLGLTTSAAGKGILGYNKTIQPALLAELESLPQAELERMAHPRDGASNKPGQALIASAAEEGNMTLVDFLCRRGITGCTPEIRALAAR